MSHNLDITDGRATYLDSRKDAWHQLGESTEGAFTAEEAMTRGLLGGWNLRKTALRTEDYETGELIDIPGRYAVVRDNPVNARPEALGVVGETYKIIPNEAHADLLNALVDESGAHFETAGALDGGRKVFITMKLPGFLRVGGTDRIENYIAAINSHDGSMAFTFMVTPVRIVCANTLNLAFSQHSASFRVRHTSGSDRNMIQQAREALDLTFNYLDGFQQEAERLIQTSLTQSRFEEIIAAEFGAPEGASAATVTRTDNKLAEMERLFADANTQEGIRNTAWAGFNALTEWADHFSPTRGDERELARATKAILEPTFKQQALKLMLAEVGR